MFRDYTKYEVFDDGRIYSYKSNRFLKPTKNNRGYYWVSLFDNNGEGKNYPVHKVVYESIKGEILEGYEINHKSERKDENFIANLELVDRKTNCNYGTRNERIAKKLTNRKDLSKQVAAYKDGVLVMTFPSAAEAERNGFTHQGVSKCCNGKLPHYKGYQWLYFVDCPPLFYISA